MASHLNPIVVVWWLYLLKGMKHSFPTWMIHHDNPKGEGRWRLGSTPRYCTKEIWTMVLIHSLSSTRLNNTIVMEVVFLQGCKRVGRGLMDMNINEGGKLFKAHTWKHYELEKALVEDTNPLICRVIFPRFVIHVWSSHLSGAPPRQQLVNNMNGTNQSIVVKKNTDIATQLDYMKITMEYILTLLNRQRELLAHGNRARSLILNQKIGLIQVKMNML